MERKRSNVERKRSNVERKRSNVDASRLMWSYARCASRNLIRGHAMRSERKITLERLRSTLGPPAPH